MSMSSIHVFDGGVIPDSESSGGSSGNANIKNLIMRDFDLNLEGETVSSKILCDYNSPQESTPYYAPVSIEDMAQWTKDGFNMQVRLESQPSVAANLGFLARISITHNSTEDEVTDAKIITYERLDDHRIKFNILNFSKVTDEVTSIDYLKLSGMDEFTLDSSIDATIAEILTKIPDTASSTNKLVTEQQLEDVTASLESGYTPKGPASVSTLNGMTGQENGDQYIVTDSGTLTDGSIAVTAGESVAWDATNEVWYKVNQYALKSVQDNVIQSIAPEFDPTRTEENFYKIHELVMYGGALKECIVNHYGAYDSSHFRDFPVSELIDLLSSHVYSVDGLDVNGTLKEYKLRLRKNDVIHYNLSKDGNATIYLYLIKGDESYTTLNTGKTDFVVDSDDYTILRVYAVSHTGEYNVDFKFSVGNELVSSINAKLNSIYPIVPELKDYMEQSTPYTVGASYTLDVPAGSMFKIKDYAFSANEGDILKVSVSVGSVFTYKVYLLVNESTYKEVAVTNGSAEFIVDRSDYTVIRLYCISNSQDTTVSLEYAIVHSINVEAGKAIQQLEYRTFISEYKENGLDKNGVLKDYKVQLKKGDVIHYSVSMEGTVRLRLYLIKTESPLVYTTLSNNKTDFVVDSDDYTILRVYTVSHTGEYDVDFNFLFVNSFIASIYNKLKEFPAADSDLHMCLPSKLYMVKGLPYNIYGDSVNTKKLVDVDFFTEPRTTSNFNADSNQIGKVCRLENLKDCSLRVGFADFVNRQSRLIYNDIDVVWNESPSGVSKNVLVVGDSITNRGAGYFASLAASSVGATITGYGTMTNYGSFNGEGREGWTWANFIGKSNLAGGNAITPMDSGTSGSLTKNPFIRLATADDKANYPDFCFTSTGVKNESSYTDDPTQTNYYIFDFQHYMDRFDPALDLDAITIALGTNDILQSYSTGDIIDYAEFMVQRIKAALPSVKICVLPSPAWGLPYDDFGSKVAPYIEAMKVLSANENFDVVGLWCFMSRCLSFGVKSSEITTINGSTKSAPYADYIHFDTDNGKVAYIEYGKILASYILNS